MIRLPLLVIELRDVAPRTASKSPSAETADTVRMALSLGSTLRSLRALRRLRGDGIDKHVERRDLAVANDDDIQAGVFRRSAPWAGAPGQTAGIVESLRLAVWRVGEVRMGRTEVTGKFVEGFTPDKN